MRVGPADPRRRLALPTALPLDWVTYHNVVGGLCVPWLCAAPCVVASDREVPKCSGVTPSSRNNHATFVVGAKLYVHGGHDGSKWLADLHCLDTEKMEWSVPITAGTPPSARACHTTSILGRKLFLFGGYDGQKCFNDLDVLDIDTMTWIQVGAVSIGVLGRQQRWARAVGLGCHGAGK